MEFACAHFGGPRYGMDMVLDCHDAIVNSGAPLIDGVAAPVAVLNEYWQVVYANRAFNAFAKVHDTSGILGQRIGEILGCGNAGESLSGCGTSVHCPACGLYQAFYDSQRHGAPMRFTGGGGMEGAVGICRQASFGSHDLRICTIIPSFWL